MQTEHREQDMKYPHIAVQYDDFHERYEVIKQVSRIAYRELAEFTIKEHAFTYAKDRADVEKLGKVRDLTGSRT